MDNRPSDDVARGRWLAITVTRIAGVVMVVVGIFGLQGVIDYPDIAAYALIGVGLVDVFVIPQVLARKWRSPPE
jgi:hypothetical protein